MKTITILAIVVVLQGCASITRGTTQAWQVTSTPSGARVTFIADDTVRSTDMVDVSEWSYSEKLTKNPYIPLSEISCTTPCTLKLYRKWPFSVRIEMDGFEPVETAVVSQTAGQGGTAMAGNLLFGGIPGALVDGTNGSTKDLTPNPLHVELRPIPDNSDS